MALVGIPVVLHKGGKGWQLELGPLSRMTQAKAGRPPSVVMLLSVLARGTRVATSIGLAPDLYEYRRREWQLALGWPSGMARQLSCSGHHQL